MDTGSTFTVISYEILESIGCNPDIPKRKKRIVTGSGYEIAPVVIVPKFHCLGKVIENKEVLAHTLPFGSFVDGLLGMDFLSSFKIDIRFHTGELIVL
ncbi:MAG: aspartyl protease family protein [bacterium]